MSSYPHPNPTKSYWIEEGPNALKNHRTTDSLPKECEIVIVGSGYSGTAVASNLLLNHEADGKYKDIVMLEARDVCSGATGRNGGHIRSFYHGSHSKYVRKYGEEVAASLVMYEHNELYHVEKIIKEYNIDCNFDPRTSCQTFDDPATYKSGLDNFYAFQNNKHIPQDVKDMVKIHFLPESDDTSEHKVGPYSITAPACSLWPYKLITSLLSKCIEKGLNLQTYTLVKNIKQTKDNGWLVQTSNGVIKCKKVVCATNAWTRSILPEFKDKIVPVKGVVSHIRPKSDTTGKLKFNYYHSFPLESDYVTAHLDKSMIVGGGGQTYLKQPNSSQMFNSIDDSFIPTETLNYFKNYPNKFYPEFSKGLEFVNDYTWTGCMAYTNDEFPFVGNMSKFGRKNLYILAGFTGHGMPRIWSCGKYVANLINDVNDEENVKIPVVFKLSLERMYSSNFELFDSLADYDYNNRGQFKL